MTLSPRSLLVQNEPAAAFKPVSLTENLVRWLPIPIGFMILSAGLAVWSVLVPLQHDHIRLETEKIGTMVANNVAAKSRAQMKTILRQAERLDRPDGTLEDFQHDTKLYLRDLPGILGMKRTSSKGPTLAAARVPFSLDAIFKSAPSAIASWEPANVPGYERSLTEPVRAEDGRLLYFLSFTHSHEDGSTSILTTALDTSIWLGDAFDHLPNYNISLLDGNEVVYRHEVGAADSQWAISLPVESTERHWTVIATPTIATVSAMASSLPTAMLIGSFLLAIATALMTHFALVARGRRAKALLVESNLMQQAARRRDAEAARDFAREELGSILESLTDGFVIVDRNWRYTYLNDVAVLLAGQRRDELIGTSIWDNSPGLQDSPEGQHLRRAMRDRISVSFERRSTDHRYYWIRTYPHLDGLALYFHDVTSQHHIADRLMESEASLNQAQSLAHTGSFVRQIEGENERWSRELFCLLGTEEAGSPSASLRFIDFVDPDDRDRVQQFIDAKGAEQDVLELKTHIVRASGETRPVRIRARVERNEENEPTSIIGTVQDISEQERNDASLAAALGQSRRQSAKFRALNRAMLLISAKLGHADLHQVLVEELREAVGAEIALLQLISGDVAAPEIFVSLSDRYTRAKDVGAVIEVLTKLARSANGKSQRYVQKDLTSHPAVAEMSALLEPTPGREGSQYLRGLLCVPLYDRNGKLLGHLQACDRDDGEFNADDEAVAVQFAQIAAVAIGWTRLVDDLRRTQRDLSNKLDEAERNRALFEEAEHVARLGSWEIEAPHGTSPIVTLSAEAARIFDVNGQQITEFDTLRDRIHPDDIAGLAKLYGSLLSGEITGMDMEFRILASDTVQWVHTKARTQRVGNPETLRVFGVVQDITARHGQIERDRLNAQTYAGIAAGIPLEVSLADVIASYENSFPDGLCSILLADAEQRLSTISAPRLPAEYNQLVNGTQAGPKAGSCGTAAWRRERVIVTDTSTDPLWEDYAAIAERFGLKACTSTPILDRTGVVLGTLAVYYRESRAPRQEELDCLDQAAAAAAIAIAAHYSREKIENSEQRFRSLFAYVPEAIYALNMAGIIVDCNDAAVAMSGYQRSELLNRSLAITVAPEMQKAFASHIALAALGAPQQIELQRVRPDGSRYITVSMKTPIIIDGALVGIFSIVRDVTEERSNQAALQEAFQIAKNHNRELEEFAFIASHDLQEPLRKVRAFGDCLRIHLSDMADPETQDYIERMRAAAERMAHLIDDLLAYSRVSKHNQRMALVPLDEVLRGVLCDLETRIDQKRATVTFEELPSLRVDATQMRQLLQNLLSNALKFSSADRLPKIHIGCEVFQQDEGIGRRSWVRLTVTDNGIGFENRYAERIFSAFQRLHGRSEYEGSGIGLAIVRRIVERHGGRIRASAKPGEGAVFTIELPQYGKDAELRSPPSEIAGAFAS